MGTAIHQIPMPTASYIIYARKSTESEDRQVLSIDAQISELKSLAAKRGLVVSEILRESQSAKSPGRPVFSQLVARISHGEVRGVLCWKLDRLARNPVDGGSIIWALKQHGLSIYTPTQSYSTAEDNTVMMYIEFGMAQKYIDDLSQNVKRGNRAKLERGELPGLAPQGYVNDLSTHTIVPDPERFPLVRRMWGLMLTGNYTVPAIVRLANGEWGYRSRKFKRIGGTKLHISGLYKIFSSPFYYGLIVRRAEGAPQFYAGTHQPMVTEEEYKRVQWLLGRGEKSRPQKHNFPYIGLIACGECGCSITAEEHRKKNGRCYVYYRCTRKRGYCTEPFISNNKLETQIREVLGQITVSDQVREWALEHARTAHSEETEARTEMYLNQQKAYATVQRQLDGLVNMHLREMVSEEEYLQKRQELQRELASLKLKLADTENRAAERLELAEQVFIFANVAKKKFDGGSEQDRREIFSALGSNFILKGGVLLLTLQKPFEFLQSANAKNEQSQHEPGLFAFGRGKEMKFELVWRMINELFEKAAAPILHIPNLAINK